MNHSSQQFARVNDAPPPGLSVAISADQYLAIEDDAGCTVEVLEGEVWMTAVGLPLDTIARRGTRVALARGRRIIVSAFRDAILCVRVPRDAREVGFALQRRGGASVLTVTAPRGEGFARWLRQLAFGPGFAVWPQDDAGLAVVRKA
jgi:hypothetical protein